VGGERKRIQRLSADVAEKIAAGEVIERPASVVKELVENSLDAGAGLITVSLRAGGKDLIRVQDDGAGIPADELPLAVARYATSKLSAAEDLWRIETYGFRGEALASIARVAELTLTSRVADAEGAMITVSGGERVEVKPAACPPGTIVEVRNLFFSVPARRKFLKRDATEFAHASEWVVRAALGAPECGFRLENEGKVVWNVLPSASLAERISIFFGPETAQKLLTVDRSGPVTVKGVAAKPDVWRADRKHLYLFVNGRFVRDRILSQAVSEAFRGYLIPGRFPFVVLSVALDPGRLDPNVHPAKAEVRFQNGQEVFQAVFRAVRAALGVLGPRTVELPSSRARRDPRAAEVADFFLPEKKKRRDPGPGGEASVPAASSFGPKEVSASPPPSSSTVASPPAPPLRSVLQVQRRYLLFESDEGVEIVDQHALHEKILYLDIMKRLARGAIPAQGLLQPVTVRLSPEEAVEVEERIALFKRLGLEVELSGPAAARIHSVPALGERADPEDLFRAVLSGSAERKEEEVLKQVAERMACRLAIKTGRSLTSEEARALVARLEEVSDSATCPHGRPTRLLLSFSQLEKHFDRR